MPRLLLVPLAALCVAASASLALSSPPSRAADKLAAEWKALAASPKGPEAEIRLLAIARLFDQAGAGVVTPLLERVSALPGASAAVRERALQLLVSARVRQGDLQRAAEIQAGRGFLSGFLVAGPFDNEGGAGLDAPYPPEAAAIEGIDLGEPMRGKDGPVRFRPAPEAIFHLGYNHLEALYDPDVNLCAYALGVLVSEKAGQAILRIGAGGAFRAFWNGREALRDTAYRGPDPDRTAARVQVNRGANRLLVKICAREERQLGFYARVTAEGAAPWPIATAPDAAAALARPIPRGAAPLALPGTAAILESAAKRTPNDAAALENAARYLFWTGAWDTASRLPRDLARKACEEKPSDSRCLLWAEIAPEANERRRAIRAALQAHPGSADALLALARLELKGPDTSRALPLIDAIREQAPGDPEAELLDLRRLSAAGFPMTAFLRAEALARRHPGIPAVADSLLDLADPAGRAAERLRLIDARLAYRFDDASAHETLAKAALARGDRARFLAEADALEKLAPFDRGRLLLVARMAEGASEKALAERLFSARTGIAPGSADAWKELGFYRMRQGEEAVGLEALRRAIALRPQDPDLADYLAWRDPTRPFYLRFAIPPEQFLQSPGPDAAGAIARYLVDQTVVRVQESGLAARYTQIVVAIDSREAARSWRSHSVQISADTQRLKLLEARVFRSDGSRKEAVSRGSVPVADPEYRLYYDVEAEVIELPPLVPGDRVELAYLIEDTVPRNLYGDYFGDFVPIEDDLPKALWRYALIAPRSRSLVFNRPSYGPLSEQRTEDGDSVTYLFEARGVPSVKREHGMPEDAAAYLHLSTYDSWEALGNWYAGLIRDALIPDARIRETAASLIRGKKTDLDKALAIYRWVVTATRYVGLEFGIHGYLPYRAPLVIARGFGDCKDKASLLVSMLGAAGVRAELALVRTNDLGDLDPLPASLAVFNHAIAYVPSIDLWLDGTAEHHGARELPFGDQDAVALRLTGKGPIFTRTPVLPPEASRERIDIDALIDADGKANLEVRGSRSGSGAAFMREALEAEATRRERFAGWLAESFPGARLGDLELSPLDRIDDPVEFRYTAFVPHFGKRTGEGIEVPADAGLDLTARYGKLASRAYDLILGPRNAAERTLSFAVPEGYRVAQLPSSQTLETRFGRLRFETEERGGKVRVYRRFELAVHRIDKESYSDFAAFCREVDSLLSQRVALVKETP